MPVCRGIVVSESGVFADILFDKARRHKLVKTDAGIQNIITHEPYDKKLDEEGLRQLQHVSGGQENLRDPFGMNLTYAEVFSCLNVCKKFHDVDPSFKGFMDFGAQSPSATKLDIEQWLRQA
jgi:hypothetical protein